MLNAALVKFCIRNKGKIAGSIIFNHNSNLLWFVFLKTFSNRTYRMHQFSDNSLKQGFLIGSTHTWEDIIVACLYMIHQTCSLYITPPP